MTSQIRSPIEYLLLTSKHFVLSFYSKLMRNLMMILDSGLLFSAVLYAYYFQRGGVTAPHV